MHTSLASERCRSASSPPHPSAGRGVRLGLAPLLARSFPTQGEWKEAMAKFI